MSDQVEIKKVFLGSYTIGYDCRNCSSRLKSPLDDAGKPDTCPDCGTQFVVPGVAEKDRIHAEAAAAAADKQRQHELAMKQAEADRQRQNEQDRRRSQEDAALKAIRQESVEAARNEHRPCPYCGEDILAVAKKCKHCGEFLDANLRPKQVVVKPPKQARETSPTTWGCLIAMILVGGCFVMMRSSRELDSGRIESPASSTGASPNVTWTKTSTPRWVDKLDPKVQTAYRNMLNESSPLYTGFYCDGNSTKVYINRSEWRLMNRFQATNNLMLSTMLPHTDSTVIEYIDDQSGEVLAKFTSQQPMGSIDVVHP